MSSQMVNEIQEKYDLSDFASWLQVNGHKGHGHSELSIQAYVSDLRGFIAWFEAHAGQLFAPELITSQDLRSYEHRSNEIERVAAATWNRRRIALAVFCQFAVDQDLVAYNPFQNAGINPKNKQKPAPKSLNKNDYARVMRLVEQAVNTAKTDHQRMLAIRNRAMVSLMVYAGVRVGELSELRASNLLLSDRKGWLGLTGKDNKEAEIPLGKEARLAVSDWMQFVEGDVLFRGITARQIQRIVHEIGLAAHVDLTPHVFRHTMIYRSLELCGGNLAVVKELARHNRIDQTARYAMPHREDLEAAVENL